MQNEQPNYYSIIPASVRYDKNLSSLEKLLYSEVTALAGREGFCWASNKYFAKLYDKNDKYISERINKLAKLGHVKIEVLNNNERRVWIIENLKGDSGKPEGGDSGKPEHNTTSINNTSKEVLEDKSSSSKEIQLKTKGENKEISALIEYLEYKLKDLGIKRLDGTVGENRNFARHLLNNITYGEVCGVVDAALKADFWKSKITSIKDIYRNLGKLQLLERESNYLDPEPMKDDEYMDPNGVIRKKGEKYGDEL